MFNNEKSKKSLFPEGMKSVFKGSSKNKSPESKNNQFIDPAILKEIIKRQLIEKNPKLLADENLLEELIKKALKEHNFVPKNQPKYEPPPVQNIPIISKSLVQTFDLLDIDSNEKANEKPEKIPVNIENIKENNDEKKDKEILEEKIQTPSKSIEKNDNKTEKIEKIDKNKINEEIKVKYAYLLQSYQFKFESNQEIMTTLSKYLSESMVKDEIKINKAFIIKVIDNLDYLRKNQLETREQEDKYQLIVHDYNKMQERLLNQENLLKSIESTYHEKMSGLEYSYQEKLTVLLIENKNLKNIIEGNERKLAFQQEGFKEEILQYQENIKKIQFDLESQKLKNEGDEKEIKALNDTIIHLQREIENYKKIKRNEKLDCYYKSQDLISEDNKSLKLENFIPTKIIYNIMEFLPPQDIIVFRSLNKLSYNCMSFDYRFYSILLKKIRNQQKMEIISLNQRLNYFKNLADKIPDEYLKASLIKFISLSEKFGDYVPPILHKSKKVFDLEEKIEISKFLNNQNSMNIEESSDMKKRVSSSSFGGNLFKKMMGLNKTPTNIIEEKPKIEKTNIQDINLLIGKLLPETEINVDLDFLKQIEYDRSQTIKQAYEKSEEFMKILGNKGIQLSNNMQKMGLFIESLQKNFCFLFVFCSVLLQEGKEIENLKNFLMSHLLQINNESTLLKNQNDDNKELFTSQKKMKEFLAAKNKEFEKRLHEADSQILKCKEEIINLSSNLKKSIGLSQNLTKEKSDLENKMKLLSKEVRFSRAKSSEYEVDLKKVVDNCLDIKFLFENLKLDI